MPNKIYKINKKNYLKISKINNLYKWRRKKDKEKNILIPNILLMALPLHAIFEGIALGALNSNSEDIIIFIGIIAHK